MSEGAPLRKSAESPRIAEQSFAHETVPLAQGEEREAIDKKIAALVTRKKEGRRFIAQTTNEKIIDIAEKNEIAIDTEIAALQLEKLKLSGQKPN